MHREEQQIRPDEDEPERDLTRALEVHAPRELREPVVHAAEDREDGRTEDDVVEVGDDEVAVRHLLVERNRDEHHTAQAADDEEEDEADDEEERRLELRQPCEDRRRPRPDLNRRRDDHHRRRPGEEDERRLRDARREHVMRPHAEADEDDEQLRDGDERERDHLPLRQRRDDLRRDPEGGNDQDVHLRVPEEPEEVLPQERRAAVRGREEPGADVPVEEQVDQIDAQRREREQQPERRGEEREAEERDAVERHPRRAVLEHRDDELRGRERRRDAVEEQPERVEVDVASRVVEP